MTSPDAETIRFVDWLYDESPVWPGQAPREKLLALYLEARKEDE